MLISSGIHAYQQYLIDNIEVVQRLADRWIKQDYRQTSSVTDMMNKLKWSTLHKRRKYSRLTTLYRFLPLSLAYRPFYVAPHKRVGYARLDFYIMTYPILKSQNIIYLTPCHTVHDYLTTTEVSHLRHQLTGNYWNSLPMQ